MQQSTQQQQEHATAAASSSEATTSNAQQQPKASTTRLPSSSSSTSSSSSQYSTSSNNAQQSQQQPQSKQHNSIIVKQMISGFTTTLDINLFFIFHFAVIYGCWYSPKPYAYFMLHYIPYSMAAIMSIVKTRKISIENILSNSIVERFNTYKELYVYYRCNFCTCHSLLTLHVSL